MVATWISDGSGWVKVTGNGFRVEAMAVKEFSRENEELCGYRFVIDLAECDAVDSTFLGTLAGMALRSRERGVGSVTVIHANATTNGLIRDLGLDRLFGTEL